MSVETWLPIPGFPGYEASDLGNIRSFYAREKGKGGAGWFVSPAPQRVLKPSTDSKTGYKHVNLRKDGLRVVGRKVHQLVTLAFLGPCPEGMEVCHEDGNPANNCLKNLRYDTHQANIQEAAQSGKMSKALTPKRAARVIKLFAQGRTPNQIADSFNVSSASVKYVLRGQTYKYLPGKRVSAMERIHERASRIREAYATGHYTMTELAKEEGMHLSAISLIINNKRCPQLPALAEAVEAPEVEGAR